jgi:hypothetical protein
MRSGFCGKSGGNGLFGARDTARAGSHTGMVTIRYSMVSAPLDHATPARQSPRSHCGHGVHQPGRNRGPQNQTFLAAASHRTAEASL